MNVNYDHRKWTNYNYPTNYSPLNINRNEKNESEDLRLFKTVTVIKDKEPVEEEIEVCKTPLILSAKTPIQADGSRYYIIRYEIEGKQFEFPIKQGDIQQRKSLGIALGNHCIVATEDKLPKTIEYLTECIKQYGKDLKFVEVHEQNGWNADKDVFVIGKQGITKNGIIPVHTTVTNPKHVNVFEPYGTEEGWVEVVTPIFKYDLTRFMFYDSMICPLLDLLNLESHCWEHYCTTSSGKTTIQMVTASAIGNVKEQMLVPGPSKVGILAHIIAMSDIPTFIDDVTSNKKREIVTSGIYEIANELESSRGMSDGKMRSDIKSFKAVTHISCEVTLKDCMTHAGEIFRLNSMEEQLPSGLDLVAKTKENIHENYGFFFPRFIQKILNNKDELKDRLADCKVNVDTSDIPNEVIDITNRSKNIFEGIMLAGRLCEEVFKEMGIPARSPDEVTKIVNRYFRECIRDSHVELDYVRALRMIHNWSVENYRNMNTESNNITQAVSCYGNMEGKYLSIIGSKFNSIMKEWDFSANIVRKGLKKEGIIEGNEKGYTSVKVNGIVTNCVKINKEKMEEKLQILENIDPKDL